jgi:hypothetical protein
MGFFEFKIPVASPLAIAFAVYTDTAAWQRCTDVTEVRWAGTPWQEGSRMFIKNNGIVPNAIDQVLLHFERDHRVAYMSHFFGISLETRVTFRALSARETEIHVRGEFVGVASRTFSFAMGSAIESSTRHFVESLNLECERLAAAEIESGLPPATKAERGKESIDH